MVNWKDPAVNELVLAALVAQTTAQGAKINYQALATLIGGGATYDAVEGRFRKIKKDAIKLQEEVDAGTRPAAPLRGGSTPKAKTSSTPTKPRPQRGQAQLQSPSGREYVAQLQDLRSPSPAVLSGRVTKSHTSTPTRKRASQYALESSPSSSSNGDTECDTNTNSHFSGHNNNNNNNNNLNASAVVTSFDAAMGYGYNPGMNMSTGPYWNGQDAI